MKEVGSIIASGISFYKRLIRVVGVDCVAQGLLRHYDILFLAQHFSSVKSGSVTINLGAAAVLAYSMDKQSPFLPREIDDADKLVETIKAKQNGKVVIVGGGYIGLELSAVMKLNNLDVTMVYPEPWCSKWRIKTSRPIFGVAFCRTLSVLQSPVPNASLSKKPFSTTASKKKLSTKEVDNEEDSSSESEEGV